MKQPEHVLLIHGLAKSAACMGPLASGLLSCGFSTAKMDYPSTADTIENLTEHYRKPELLKHADALTLHIVTHSLGGVLVRQDANGAPFDASHVVYASGNLATDLYANVTAEASGWVILSG
jgi:alpha-beta hydrolase superfamily lysophospholipase